ncbi:N-acetylmuramoyl-L-alanine amidase [Rhodovulum iodosum]|uniref:N-acetylmuramoyl-L-alanine amidase n=1 Tax=Rhodovulum iodosum TaxID=68291 RepID=A0ABV3XXT4_9RHOB|nr:N-acetylmuramoyl-L-alanine amidase [Rhodovulum robiginosum]RSK38164.1 N-acetylmuramoyl-L-alanine amidase [Rhodovulum robiginosum]
MGRIFAAFSLAAALAVCAAGAGAEALSALARPDAARSSIRDEGRGVVLDLWLSLPVPYRVFTLTDPPRAVVDFNEVDFAGFDPARLARTDRVGAVRAGALRPGWSRLVMELSAPLPVDSAEMRRDSRTGRARLVLGLGAADADRFAAASGTAGPRLLGVPEPAVLPPPRRRQDGSRALRVVLDPGHGGIDPGAERDGVREADLMLTFARELREVLRRAGMEVSLTRDDDVFVPLEHRISIARMAGADVFLSLHADALAEGRASGATVYTMSETASDRASQLLAERHDRDELLAGVDLSRQGDRIANMLMDMVRRETVPRSDKLADALVAGLTDSVGRMHKRPRLEAAFSVLKAPDIPSVLIELGFLSSAQDRADLASPEWRGRAARGIAAALAAWAVEDAAEASLLRR